MDGADERRHLRAGISVGGSIQQDLVERQAQSPCDTDKDADRWESVAALEKADVILGELQALGEIVLAPAAFVTGRGYGGADLGCEASVAVHGPNIRRPVSLSDAPIRVKIVHNRCMGGRSPPKLTWRQIQVDHHRRSLVVLTWALMAGFAACGSVTGVSPDGGPDAGSRKPATGGSGGTTSHMGGATGAAAGTNGAGGGGPTGAAGAAGNGPGPCAGICVDPIEITTQTFSSGSLPNTPTCYETTFDISGGSCDIVSGRTFLVNSVAETCDNQPWPSLPTKVNGGYCFQAPMGDGSYTLSFRTD